MDYLKKFKTNLAYHFSEVLEYPFAYPYWIYISLSHKCTYSCQMCGVVNILKGYELPTDVVRRALREISQWKNDCTITLTGGEIFLRHDVFDIVDCAVQQGIKIEAVSNGSLIDKDLAHRIVSSGLQNIAISLDGSTENTHDSIRNKGAFIKAVAAINNLVVAKRTLGKGLQISVWVTIMKENVNELFDILKIVEGIGIDCLVFHPVIVAQADMQNTSPNAPFWIRGEDLKMFKKQIGRIADYQKKQGLVAFLHDPYLWLKYFDGTLGKTHWKCNPFVFINIGPDGEVRSCGKSFGNIHRMSLDECFHTKDADDARKVMKACQKPCLQTCWSWPQGDLLRNIFDDFLADIAKSDLRISEKETILREAENILTYYEKLLREKNA